MNNEEKKEEVHKLVKYLNFHSQQYHVHGKSSISDSLYDAEYRRLLNLESDSGIILKDSPTQRVGEKIADSAAKIHRTSSEAMLSLDNAFTEDELRKFYTKALELANTNEDIYLDIDQKLDGLSIDIQYNHGLLAEASSRGDGIVGEDYTHGVRVIRQIPLRLNGCDHIPELHVRGEIYLTYEDFERLNKEKTEHGDEPFSNCRNAAAGLMRVLDPKITKKGNLKFTSYGISNP